MCPKIPVIGEDILDNYIAVLRTVCLGTSPGFQTILCVASHIGSGIGKPGPDPRVYPVAQTLQKREIHDCIIIGHNLIGLVDVVKQQGLQGIPEIGIFLPYVNYLAAVFLKRPG